MSTPITHESTSVAPATREKTASDAERIRRIVGIVVGLGLAALVFYFFPSSGVDQINEVGMAAADKAGKDDYGDRKSVV